MIKELYHKDRALAIKAAKVLGYTIKAVKILSFDELPDDIKLVLENIGWNAMNVDIVEKVSSYHVKSDEVINKKSTALLSKFKKFKFITSYKNKLGIVFAL